MGSDARIDPASSYLSLETLRKSGAAIATPVWFATADDGTMVVYSLADAGKVKRVRNNGRVRVAPCDLRGNLEGEWIEAEARIADEAGAARGQALLDRKYFLKRLGNVWSRLLGRRHAVIEIRVKDR